MKNTARKTRTTEATRPQLHEVLGKVADDQATVQLVLGLQYLVTRERKAGPQIPVTVAQCRTHRRAFTLYPLGHVPYGRLAVAPVTLDGQVVLSTQSEPTAGDPRPSRSTANRSATSPVSGRATQQRAARCIGPTTCAYIEPIAAAIRCSTHIIQPVQCESRYPMPNMSNILLLMPLTEEFNEVIKIFPIISYNTREDEFLYTLASPSPNAKITGVVLGDSGPMPAAQRTERLIRLTEPTLVVVIGIAGALSNDVGLADVVIAEEIDHYLANSKAKPDKEGFAWSMSGRHTRSSYSILQIIRNFQFAGHSLYKAWQSECLARAPGAKEPIQKLGHIACGDTVSDAKAFKDFLLAGSDRKYLAIEMESSGVAEAAIARQTPIPLLILRGISDNSEGKAELDLLSNSTWRITAIANAASFLKHLLLWPDFSATIERAVTLRSPFHEAHLNEVIEFIKAKK